MDTKKKEVPIMPYKLKELASIYKLSNYMMRLLIQPHQKALGKRVGHYYSYEQVEKIFKRIHLPSNIDIVA